MGSVESEAETLVRGQREIWQLMFGFADSMALKCAVELRLADIIHSHHAPITLPQLASKIDSPRTNTLYLERIMRMLVRRGIFTAHRPSDGGEATYSLTDASKWLLHDSDLTLAPMVLMENHPWQLAPWHCLSQCIKEGGIAFKLAHGCEMWDFASQNPDFNKLFNDGLACAAKIIMRAFLSKYSDGFSCIQSLVDVGGGTGSAIAEIVKSYPHIKGMNFDLPHVVSTAPSYNGVQHLAGDMFEAIPKADAVFVKWVLHDWGDEDCVRILKNCRKAIPEENGKLILLEIIVQENTDDQFGGMGMIFDLLMFAHTTGGKERTELEWKKLLEKGGFSRYKIIRIPALPSIIEAYPI